MNWSSLIISLAAVGSLYSLLLGVVRYFSLNNPTPKNLSDIYDTETYEKWKKYSKKHSKLEIISSIVSGVITILLLTSHAYAEFARLFPLTIEWQIFGVILLSVMVDTVVGTVKSYVSTMKIEEKYGFNRSSMKTFVADRIRALIISLIISWLIAYGLDGAYYFGIWMIPAATASMFLFSIVISSLYPIFSRIGNKFTSLPDGELRESLTKLLHKYGFKIKDIRVMDASRRTTKLNAYFAGVGKTKTIVLYDTLVDTLTVEEITAVFAHELGHGLHRDIQKRQVLGIFQFLLISIAAYILLSVGDFYWSFGFGYLNSGFTYILLGIVLSVLQPLFGLFVNATSRRAEFRADRQAVVEGYGEVLISALKKMAKSNFSHLSPSWINVVLEYSHPPMNARIKSIEREIKRREKTKAKK